ncbi:response regulator transcription factor [Clostridiaceae bacterium M8S5]|nr:response regulator transcription factor [Clostridiaceae bacterium M8S5]
MSERILIVDDEKDIVNLLELYLESEGYTVVKAYNGIDALKFIKEQNIDMAILDIMMPGIDGYRLIKKIRENYKIPILMLSAKREHHDKILGLELGADDYMTKPFNPMEVIARIKAQLRRCSKYNNTKRQVESDYLQLGNLRLDLPSCTLYKDGNSIELTSREFLILKMLMQNPSRVFTKKQIFEEVWEDQFYGDDNTIMVHISNLRNKIEQNPKQPVYIKTIRGLGYKIDNIKLNKGSES